MFGSSPISKRDKETDATADSPPKIDTENTASEGGGIHVKTDNLSPATSKRNSLSTSSGRKSQDEGSPAGEGKKRRSSSAQKAAALFSSARASLHLTGHHGDKSEGSTPQTPMQKLGRTDPVLSVPQGSLNNSAGESMPTARSSFRVGVTEDKNKKCRRTMEDTHAYLYNFLGTPAPSIPPDTSRQNHESTSESANPVAKDDTESQHIIETDNGYFAIFDGHAGTFAAEWCGKKLHVILEDIMRRNPNTPVPELLDQTFTSVDQQLEKLPLKNSGTTAIIAVLRWEDRVPNAQSATGSTSVAPAAAAVAKANDADSGETPTPTQDAPSKPEVNNEAAVKAVQKVQDAASRQRVLYTANVGDARIILCRNGKALRLSYDHKGSDENEGKRISQAGGLILNNRVNGVLAVTRALGDSYLKDLVTGHPYTTETVIQPDIDEFLILACDGLWDVCTDQEAVDLIRHTQSPQAASKLLVDHALARFSTDNLSVMVVRFDSKVIQTNTNSSIGVESDPANKEKGAISEVQALVNEAKRRSGISNDQALASDGDDELSKAAIQEVEEEEQEPGPELTPEGDLDIEKVKAVQEASAAKAT
ncbi:MAG: hypothetical protein Q9227_004514 [Pyrenula ochraceoflavens]